MIESSPLSRAFLDSTQAWTVLSGDELEKAKGATIAETLSKRLASAKQALARLPTVRLFAEWINFGSACSKMEPTPSAYPLNPRTMPFRLIP